MGVYQRGTTWWIKYKVDGRRFRESAETHDRRKAEIVLKARLAEAEKLRHAVKLGLPVPEQLADAKMSLVTFLDRYKEHYLNAGGPALRESRERSWRSDLSSLKCVLDFFERKGVTKVNRATRRHVEAFRDWRLTTEVSGETVNKGLRCGKAAWSWAIRSGFAQDPNPFKGVPMVTVPRYDPRNLSEFEVRRLLEAAVTSGLFALLATAIYAGLRLGELAALEWTDIDFGGEGAQGGGTAGFVHVRCNRTFKAKNRKPRIVPLAPELRAILLPLRQPTGLCFPSPATGGRRNLTDISHQIARIAKAAGIECTLHDLRRTFASLLADRGVPMTRIRDYLGHSSIATTEGYYLARGTIDPADVAKLAFGVVGKPEEPGAQPHRATA